MVLQAEKMKMVCFLSISLLCSVCEAHVSEISHPDSFQAVELGNTVTITCWIYNTARHRVWYKLTTGRRLQPVALTDTLYNLTTFKMQSHHYVVKSQLYSSQLSITSTIQEDAGTYYCGVMNLYDIQFGSGTFLIVKGANMISNSVVQQPEYKSVHPGDSVTLSCSVHTDHCAAEHTSVMWLKNSDHSAPEIIYSSGNKNNSCQRTILNSGETACVYNVLIRNLRADDAGTYYCAVNSCGRILFGNGTRINVHNDAFTKSGDLSPAVIGLMLSNSVLGMVTLLLVWTLCKNKKDPAVLSTASASRPSDGSPGDYQTKVMYASVYVAPRSSSCRPAPVKHSGDETIYSDINP